MDASNKPDHSGKRPGNGKPAQGGKPAGKGPANQHKSPANGAKKMETGRTSAGNASVRKRVSKKTKKVDKILRIVGYVMVGVFFLIACLALLYVARLKMVPRRYMLLAGVVVLMLTALLAGMQHWRIPGLAAKGLSLIMSVVLVILCVYVRFTHNKIQDFTGVTTKVDNIHIYVLNEDPAQSVNDAKDYHFGILSTLDRANTDQVVGEISKELSYTLVTEEKEDIYKLIDGLYAQETKAIVLNNAYVGFLADMEGYADFESRVRSIGVIDIQTEVSTPLT